MGIEQRPNQLKYNHAVSQERKLSNTANKHEFHPAKSRVFPSVEQPVAPTRPTDILGNTNTLDNPLLVTGESGEDETEEQKHPKTSDDWKEYWRNNPDFGDFDISIDQLEAHIKWVEYMDEKKKYEKDRAKRLKKDEKFAKKLAALIGSYNPFKKPPEDS
jgi:hypothetical protein